MSTTNMNTSPEKINNFNSTSHIKKRRGINPMFRKSMDLTAMDR